ncbi:hypothetical protein L3Q82_025917 [Scortum barcoo]|uniref:Uncharacterized protein n=1 Tax=Scortum barcoo TaxID=214431 RepID=A0ACB8WLJ8_9TELE|nr:hypothetical protein L3Q82_025917 [Scortum barcoo]
MMSCRGSPIGWRACPGGVARPSDKARCLDDHPEDSQSRGALWDESIPVSTVGAIIRKWKKHHLIINRPRTGAPRKISDQGVRKMVRRVLKEPRTTRKALQKDMEGSSEVTGSAEVFLPGGKAKPFNFHGLWTTLPDTGSFFGGDDSYSFPGLKDKAAQCDLYTYGLCALRMMQRENGQKQQPRHMKTKNVPADIVPTVSHFHPLQGASSGSLAPAFCTESQGVSMEGIPTP